MTIDTISLSKHPQLQTQARNLLKWMNRSVRYIENSFKKPAVQTALRVVCYSTSALFATAAIASLYAAFAFPALAYSKAIFIGPLTAAYTAATVSLLSLLSTHFCVETAHVFLMNARALVKK